MNTVTTAVKSEPVLTWGTVLAVLNAVQLLAIPGLPAWVHTLIMVVTTIVTALASRSQVTPAKVTSGGAS